MPAKWLLYGANGYTGKLILEAAALNKNLPIVSGRNNKEIKELADKYGCEYLISDAASLSDNLKSYTSQNIKLILNCAGPFINTYKGIIEACLAHSIHYTDITGEWTVMEALADYDTMAKEKGIAIMPGIGFDVVPTDCLSLKLSQMITNPQKLKLGFVGMNKASRGTLKSAVLHAHRGNYSRSAGKIKKIPFKNNNECVEIDNKKHNLINIPWGDIFTAFYTTNIPNIEVQTSIPKKVLPYVNFLNFSKHLLRISFIKNIATKYIDQKLPKGPKDSERSNSRAYIFGTVQNDAGESAELCWSTPEGYTLTSMTSIKIIDFILKDNEITGFKTPAGAFGYKWFLELEGIQIDINKKSC